MKENVYKLLKIISDNRAINKAWKTYHAKLDQYEKDKKKFKAKFKIGNNPDRPNCPNGYETPLYICVEVDRFDDMRRVIALDPDDINYLYSKYINQVELEKAKNIAQIESKYEDLL